MATIAEAAAPKRVRSLAPDLIERGLAVTSLLMLAMLAAAVVRGRAGWGDADPYIWLHLATIAIALAITPVMMLRRRGDRLHRRLGWLWCAAMFSTALISFAIREANGQIGPIHIFSVLTIVSVPLIVLTARSHKHEAHRRSVRGLLIGALMIAGVFTLVPGRLLGEWLLG